jgi:hypothetical protein
MIDLMSDHLRRLAAVAVMALGTASCFEPPVAEDLRLEFLPQGLVTLTVRVLIRDGDDSNVALSRRIEEARRDALAGTDAWSRRFEAFGPVIERGEWEKHEGKLVSMSHSATTDDPEALSRFFADTGVAIEWRTREDRAELAIYPPSGGSATRQERQRVTNALDEWSQVLADYFARSAVLWRHLESNPDRARACLAHLFSEEIPEDEVNASGEISEDERRIIGEVSDAIDEVIGVLAVPKGEAYTLDELSRRVYDPFPAPIAIRVPAPILEVEGFDSVAGGGELHAGGTSLWQALRRLEGRWLSPDPAIGLVDHDLAASGQPFPLTDFLTRRRTFTTPPSSGEVRKALSEGLAPVTAYRVTWSQPEDQDTDDDATRK